jgi:hypothetical protein
MYKNAPFLTFKILPFGSKVGRKINNIFDRNNCDVYRSSKMNCFWSSKFYHLGQKFGQKNKNLNVIINVTGTDSAR